MGDFVHISNSAARYMMTIIRYEQNYVITNNLLLIEQYVLYFLFV